MQDQPESQPLLVPSSSEHADPQLTRIGDVDRAAVVSQIQQAMATGHIGFEELDERFEKPTQPQIEASLKRWSPTFPQHRHCQAPPTPLHLLMSTCWAISNEVALPTLATAVPASYFSATPSSISLRYTLRVEMLRLGVGRYDDFGPGGKRYGAGKAMSQR